MTSKEVVLVILFSLLILVGATSLATVASDDTAAADEQGGDVVKIKLFITYSFETQDVICALESPAREVPVLSAQKALKLTDLLDRTYRRYELGGPSPLQKFGNAKIMPLIGARTKPSQQGFFYVKWGERGVKAIQELEVSSKFMKKKGGRFCTHSYIFCGIYKPPGSLDRGSIDALPGAFALT